MFSIASLQCVEWESRMHNPDKLFKARSKTNFMEEKKLKEMLQSNNLHADLYNILQDNDIFTLSKLRNVKESDIPDLNTIQKLKFRKLMKIVSQTESNNRAKVNMTHRTIQVLLIGDNGVGKTSLLNRYLDNNFDLNEKSTTCVDFMCKDEIVSDESITTLKIWDIDQEEYQDSLKQVDCVVICYDVKKQTSFYNCHKWRKQIEEYANNDIIVFLVGCKSDLLHCDRVEYEEKAQRIINQKEWKKLNTIYCECSAKLNDNICNVFVTIAELENKKHKKKKMLVDQNKLSNKPINRKDTIRRKIHSQISSDACSTGSNDISSCVIQ